MEGSQWIVLQCMIELNWGPINTKLSVRDPVQQLHVNRFDKNEGDVALMRIIFPDCYKTQIVCCYMEYVSFQVIDAGHFWAQKPESESARGLQMLQDRINNNEGRNLRVRRMINLFSVCKADAVFFLFLFFSVYCFLVYDLASDHSSFM